MDPIKCEELPYILDNENIMKIFKCKRQKAYEFMRAIKDTTTQLGGQTIQMSGRCSKIEFINWLEKTGGGQEAKMRICGNER